MLRWWRGDALEGVKIYANNDSTFAGRLFEWPFESVLLTPFRTAVSLWETTYIWSYVALVLGGCVLAVRKLKRSSDTAERDVALFTAVWLLGNTAFVACMGNIWGFHYFDRHILAALPPLLWAYRDYYPRRPLDWVVISASSIGLALYGLVVSAV
jgi:hypothetical protein